MMGQRPCALRIALEPVPDRKRCVSLVVCRHAAAVGHRDRQLTACFVFCRPTFWPSLGQSRLRRGSNFTWSFCCCVLCGDPLGDRSVGANVFGAGLTKPPLNRVLPANLHAAAQARCEASM